MKLVYEGYDRSGRSVRDTLEAGSVDEARERLRREGLFVTRVQEGEGGEGSGAGSVGVPAGGQARRRIGTGRRLKNLAMFTRQLYVLSSTGTPLVDALGALERQTRDQAWAQVVAQVRGRVEEGVPLSEAMAERPDCFDAVFRSLVQAGETGGTFTAMLDRLATLVRKQAQVRKTVTGAMVYPVLLLGVSGVVLTLMLVFVLPRFTGLFHTLDVPLPPTTQMLIVMSDVLRGYWWALIGGTIGLGFGMSWWLRTPSGREAWDTAMVKIPVVRDMTRNFVTARIARLLATLIESGVPLLDALDLTRKAAGNSHYRRLIDRAEDAVTRGDEISTVLADEPLVSPSFYEAVRSGEQTGKVGALLLNMSDFLDEENEVMLRSLTSILEPIILLGLGLLVGGVAISMFLPLFDLTASAGGGG